MSEQLQLRRGTSSQVAAFTGAQGETVMDTTNNRLVVNDGSTAGGWPAAKLGEVQTNTRTSVSDAPYTAQTTDRLVAYTALTATRQVSLPAASSFPKGSMLTVVDETGNCSGSVQIVVAPNGADDINGVNADYPITIPYGWVDLESNGTSWTIVGQMAAAQGSYGANMQLALLETLVSGMTGGTVTGPSIPANSIVLAVGAYVKTTITGATSYEVGVSGNLSQFGSSLALPAGSSNFGLIGPTAFYSATPIQLTAAGSSFTAGAVRVSIHFILCNPSTN
jgi:hypothetical protein